MKLYHLYREKCGYDNFFEFTVYASSHQEAFNLAKKHAKYYSADYDFDDNISHWKIEVVKLDKPQVIQDSILYG